MAQRSGGVAGAVGTAPTRYKYGDRDSVSLTNRVTRAGVAIVQSKFDHRNFTGRLRNWKQGADGLG
jgi:hypothetical protein